MSNKSILYLTIAFITITLACGSGSTVTDPAQPVEPITQAEQPADTPTPAPTPTLPTFAPQTYSGSGDSIVNIDKPTLPTIAQISGNNDGQYFGVTALDANGDPVDLLVNTSQPYEGVRPVDFKDGEHTSRFEVQASGNWTIRLLPLTDARVLQVPGSINGSGDDVLLLRGSVPDTAVISGNAGEGYFGVTGYGERVDLMVNTTEAYKGEVIVKADTIALVVQAVGEWSVEVKGK